MTEIGPVEVEGASEPVTRAAPGRTKCGEEVRQSWFPNPTPLLSSQLIDRGHLSTCSGRLPQGLETSGAVPWGGRSITAAAIATSHPPPHLVCVADELHRWLINDQATYKLQSQRFSARTLSLLFPFQHFQYFYGLLVFWILPGPDLLFSPRKPDLCFRALTTSLPAVLCFWPTYFCEWTMLSCCTSVVFRESRHKGMYTLLF